MPQRCLFPPRDARISPIRGTLNTIIRKGGPPRDPPPLLADYAAQRASFSWEAVAQGLGVPLAGPLNLGELACTRGGTLVWHGAHGEEERYPAAELAARSGRFANALKSLGIAPGDRVALLFRAIPQLAFAFLGALRAGAVPCIMGRVRNATAIKSLLERTGARVAVIEADARPFVGPLRGSLPELKHLILLQSPEAGPDELRWEDVVDKAELSFAGVPLAPDAPAYLQYSDLGLNGAVAGHRAAFALASSASLALDLRPGEGLVTLSVPGDTLFVPYLLLAPLLLGATTFLFEDPARFPFFGKFKDPVHVWYSPVRAIDVVIRNDPGLAALLSSCRHIAVSHPYDAPFVAMTQLSWGSPLHPTWFPREMGAIQCAEFRSSDLQLDSVGRPLPGVELALEPGTDLLMLRQGPSSPFTGYWGDTELTGRRIRDGWFVSDQRGRIERDGYAWLVS